MSVGWGRRVVAGDLLGKGWGRGQEQVRCMGAGSARRRRGWLVPRRGFAVLSAKEGEGAGAAGREVRSWALAPGGLLHFLPAAALPCFAFLPSCFVRAGPRGHQAPSPVA